MYLSLGMSYDEFWNDDPYLVKYYREAQKYKNEKTNQEAWLQGAYIFEAVSVSLTNAFAKKGTKPKNYAKEPYRLNNKENKEEQQKLELAKAQQWIQNWASFQSKKFKAKKEP